MVKSCRVRIRDGEVAVTCCLQWCLVIHNVYKVPSLERLDDQLITRSGNAPNTL